MDGEGTLLGTAEVARRLDVDPETVRGWIKRKLLPSIKYSCGCSRIRQEDVSAFTLPRRGPRPKHLLAALLLLALPLVAYAHPADATVRIPSHGGSGTVIATGDGWTYILSCAHCFQGGSRNKPVKLDLKHPQPGPLQKVGVTVVAVGNPNGNDLALLKLHAGPMPYVAPVAPVGFRAEGIECWSAGFDEMKFPMTLRGAKVVSFGSQTIRTDARPWHGRSGGALIDKQTGYLIGVVNAYTGPKNHAEFHPGAHGIYASLPAIHRFLAKAGVMDGQGLTPEPPSLPRPAPRPTQPFPRALPPAGPGGC